HPGHMAQVGFNSGPRNAKVWGRAKSYVKKLPQDIMVLRDEDILAAMSLLWRAACIVMPDDIIGPISSKLAQECLPSMTTRNVTEVTGWSIEDDAGVVYQFPEARFIPPEGYLTQDYVA
ncbi:hypothetical protein CONPUDRAFT_68245, partial [Coniophora puteana RWD-64-598 SS2]